MTRSCWIWVRRDTASPHHRWPKLRKKPSRLTGLTPPCRTLTTHHNPRRPSTGLVQGRSGAPWPNGSLASTPSSTPTRGALCAPPLDPTLPVPNLGSPVLDLGNGAPPPLLRHASLPSSPPLASRCFGSFALIGERLEGERTRERDKGGCARVHTQCTYDISLSPAN